MRHFMLLVIYLNLSLLRADISNLQLIEIKEYPGLGITGEGYIYPLPLECSEVLDAFALSASNFTMCSISYARPIRLCEKCVDHFVSFNATYTTLLSTVVNGTSCRSLFISHDRLNAVAEYYSSILAIWDKGNCQTCYDWYGVKPELSNNTKHFNKKYNLTMECIINNINPSLNNSDKVCNTCMQTYIDLDNFYKSISVDGIGVDTICMDVVDSMNATRSIWSKTLNCCKLRWSKQLIFLCCTAVIAMLPLLFYVIVRYCGPIRDLPNVLKQSRFKQTILRSVERSD